jgi:hypothetical protein
MNSGMLILPLALIPFLVSPRNGWWGISVDYHLHFFFFSALTFPQEIHLNIVNGNDFALALVKVHIACKERRGVVWVRRTHIAAG